MTCPFTGEHPSAVSALNPDVTVVHAQRADREGNVQLWGIVGIQKEAVLAANRAVATVEEVVDHLDRVPGDVVLPSWCSPPSVPCRAAPTRRTPTATALGTTASTEPGTASAATGIHSRRGSTVTFATLAITPSTWPGWPPVMAETGWTADEMMTVAAARALPDRATLFVGIGLPSTAANLARLTHAPNLVLHLRVGHHRVPPVPPSPVDRRRDAREHRRHRGVRARDLRLLAATGTHRYRIPGAAQIDRRANINTIVIGDYDRPAVRLPGAGGALEISSASGEVIVVVRQHPRAFVERLDFVTSVGHGDQPGDRRRLGMPGRGPTLVIADFGVLRPEPETCELMLTAVHPGVTPAEARDATGWPLAVAPDLEETEPPTGAELDVLRHLEATKGVGEAVAVDVFVRPDDLAATVVRGSSTAHRRSRAPASDDVYLARPIRPARTTATWPGWRCCWPGWGRRCPAPR